MPEIPKMKSEEEYDFYYWLLELQKLGIVSEIRYEPESFVLSEKVTIPVIKTLKTKTKISEKTLLRTHEYTPDFVFVLEHRLPVSVFIPDKGMIYVDTKGDFKGKFDRHDAKRRFSVDQKWMYQRYQIYVNKIVPKILFAKTFVPHASRGVTGRRFSGLPHPEEFLRNIQEEINVS